jgi:hypothetical protein
VCPTFSKQDENWDLVFSQLNRENIQALLDPVHMDLVDFKVFTDNPGFVNKIVFLTAKSRLNAELIDLVLKLVEGFACWRPGKTTSEATIMKFIRENTSIPVPKVYAYADDTSNPIRAH